MIYTVGRKEAYDRGLEEYGEKFEKKGREGDYCGGSVWETVEEASLFAKEGFAVYGVLADWETDTAPSENGKWHDLLRHSRIVKV